MKKTLLGFCISLMMISCSEYDNEKKEPINNQSIQEGERPLSPKTNIKEDTPPSIPVI